MEEAMTTMRSEKKYRVGDVGAVYEFDIKLPVFHGINISDDDFAIEARDSIQHVRKWLRDRYTWVGQIYQTGRSGGWLAVEDKKGLATMAKLKAIAEKIESEKKLFMQMLRRNYPA